jgi:hypothetical protein
VRGIEATHEPDADGASASAHFSLDHAQRIEMARRIARSGVWGVSLIGEDLLFKPLRRYVAERGFAAFAGLTEIVPAALGEDVVIHGALALARKRFGGPRPDREGLR